MDCRGSYRSAQQITHTHNLNFTSTSNLPHCCSRYRRAQLTTQQAPLVPSSASNLPLPQTLQLPVLVLASPRPANHKTSTTRAFLYAASLVAGVFVAAPNYTTSKASALPLLLVLASHLTCQNNAPSDATRPATQTGSARSAASASTTSPTNLSESLPSGWC